jgi:hypothetical protein
MRCKVCILLLFGFMLPRLNTLGCIWDAETMIQERLAHPDMAKLILGEPHRRLTRRRCASAFTI